MSKIWINKKLYIVDEEVQAHIDKQAKTIEGNKEDMAKYLNQAIDLQDTIDKQAKETAKQVLQNARLVEEKWKLQARIDELEGAVDTIERVAVNTKKMSMSLVLYSEFMDLIIEKTEALPAQPKCKTCGRSREVSSDACFSGRDTLTEKVEPCPDCT